MGRIYGRITILHDTALDLVLLQPLRCVRLDVRG
jgi:hypothetical protein